MKSAVVSVAFGLVIALVAAPVHAVPATVIEFDTELTQMTLAGGPFPIPLASDPGNNLGDSVEGYGFVDSDVTITLSSQRVTSPGQPSLGHVTATTAPPNPTGGELVVSGVPDPEPINPDDLHGQTFYVDSFFDVYFDITFTDVDSRGGRDYAGQPDGASIVFQDNGASRTTARYEAIFDKDAPTFGLLPPPEAEPWVGFVDVEIALGADINGNGENDKIKFTLGTISAGDENRTFIELPDGTVILEFDAGALFEGAVVDESTDPPFTIGATGPTAGLPDPAAFGGPTTAESNLLNPLAGQPGVPEPAGLGLIGLAMLGMKQRSGR